MENSIQLIKSNQIDRFENFENKGIPYLKIGSIIVRRDDICLVTRIENLDSITFNEKNELQYNDCKCYVMKYLSLEDLKENKPKWGEIKEQYLEWCYWGDVFSSIQEFEEYLKKADSVEEVESKEEVSESTEIARLASKELLESQLILSQQISRKYSLLMAVQNYKIRVMEEYMKKALRIFQEQHSLMIKQVSKIKKLIWTVELYLGVNEEVVQLKEGETSNETINYFQKILYMDVEYGKPGDESIDFNNIEQFDRWLIKDNNFKMFTTPRCIRVFRVRKTDKKYSENPWINAMINQENHKTYFLIRNGENLYRVYADIIVNKLFPDQDEFIEIQNKYSHSWDQKQKEESFDQYKRQIITLQGLTVRTNIFDPLPENFNLMNPEVHDSGLIKFVYSKNELTDNSRESFKEWKNSINSKVGVGSRILWISCNDGLGYDRFSDRFYNYQIDYKYNQKAPNPPETGSIFHIYETGFKKRFDKMGMIPKKSEDLSFREKYSDKEIIQNNTSFYFNDYDSWINYDLCTLEDVRYYLNRREEREEYLHVFPILLRLEKMLIEDKKYQDEFKKMIQGYFGGKIEDWRIYWAIDWWKIKNKWKRSLQSEDCTHEAKAFKMIVKKLTPFVI